MDSRRNKSVFDKAALYIYLGTFFLLVGAGLGLPVPGEVAIVAGGFSVGHSSEDPDRLMMATRIMAGFAGSPVTPFPAWPALVQISEITKLPAPAPHVPLRWWIMLPLCILGVVISDG